MVGPLCPISIRHFVFPYRFSVDAEVASLLPTCYGLVDDTANYFDMSRCRCQVRNELATSRCNGIWEKTPHNRLHDGLLPAPTCYRFAAGKIRGNWCNGFSPLLDI